MIAPVEDLLARSEQPNLPGTVDEHPNWRRRLPLSADTIMHDPEVVGRIRKIKGNRS
jgi:4-alpha-glucanotransferase